MRKRKNNDLFFWFCCIPFVLTLATMSAHARDVGQWNEGDQTIKQWYQTLTMPDNPTASCCGEADAYWADSYEASKDGEYIAIITDDRPNEPLKRTPVEVGTRIIIPKYKIKWNQGNPTGHGIVFLSSSGSVYCYVPPGGV